MSKVKGLFKKAIIEAKYLGLNQGDIENLLAEIVTEIEGGISHD